MKFWHTQADIDEAYEKGHISRRRAVGLAEHAKMAKAEIDTLTTCFEYMRLGEFDAALDAYARVESYRATVAYLAQVHSLEYVS